MLFHVVKLHRLFDITKYFYLFFWIIVKTTVFGSNYLFR